ncbi:Aste57867_12747 [Aphanomyces stellatus]|uniref:Aste57867_12747 protein n=1 Tax=Aphanomyces stellatus TaxID=120398 RepID=A0A485KWE2_9STRA|nr:hypothetical protein As57867_012699 [Aphanomyces stellatus]VFT89597.1 Aste57867_12747 [Aphanomyces stellatus]
MDYCNTPLVVVNADSMEINAAQHAIKAAAPENKLMIVQGAIDGKSVRILIDCGASNLLCRPGLAKKVIRSKEVQAEGFDRHFSGIKKVNEAAGTLCFGQWTFSDLIFTEWDLGKKDFDIILGKPWFFRFNPIINWRENRVLSVSSSEAAPEEMEAWMIKVTTVKVPQPKLHPKLATLVKEFSDLFPDKLPNELPPKRGIEFDLIMKSDAKPQQHRPPFRLSKLEECSLDKFVGDLLQKGWIELSNSVGLQHLWCSQAK